MRKKGKFEKIIKNFHKRKLGKFLFRMKREGETTYIDVAESMRKKNIRRFEKRV